MHVFPNLVTYVPKEKASLVLPGPFLAQGVHYLQYKHPANALYMIFVLHSYLYVLNYLAGPAHSCIYVAYVMFTLNIRLSSL